MSIRAKIKVDLLSKIEASSSGVLEPMNFSVLILSTFFQTIDFGMILHWRRTVQPSALFIQIS